MDKEFHYLLRNRKELTLRYDAKTKALWYYTNPKNRPCYSAVLVKEYKELQKEIIEYFELNNMYPKTEIKYLVSASKIPGIYNYGGDLQFFLELIKNNEKEKLFQYAKSCIDVVYLNSINLNLPIITVALVEGEVLGGGFEEVISHNVTIVEEHIETGFPEIKFNLFPGMGAYTFLAKSIGIKKAEELILSGKIYSVKNFHKMGLITHLAPKGEGVDVLNKFMKNNARFFNGMQAIQSARQRHAPLDYDELIDITKIWVEAALRLERKDLKMMQKLVDAQNQRIDKITYKLRTKQDRRFDVSNTEFPLEDAFGNIIKKERRSGKDPRTSK